MSKKKPIHVGYCVCCGEPIYYKDGRNVYSCDCQIEETVRLPSVAFDPEEDTQALPAAPSQDLIHALELEDDIPTPEQAARIFALIGVHLSTHRASCESCKIMKRDCVQALQMQMSREKWRREP